MFFSQKTLNLQGSVSAGVRQAALFEQVVMQNEDFVENRYL